VLLTRSAVSTVGHLKELLPESQVSADQNTASWTRAFDTMDMRTEALAGWHSLETLLYSRMQTLNVSLSIGAPTIPGHPATGGKSVESGADWTERSFTIGPAPFMPQTITPMLDMDGVRLTSISYTDGNWTYEGTIYAH
jgi:hypothetical protein